MSEQVIDVTRRSRVRALAARMHRTGIADVFSTAGGTAAVDESALSDEQRAEATKILEDVAAGSLSVEDVEAASQTVAIIRHYAKPSCAVCCGTGVVRRGASDDVCGCVDRRWQAKADREAFAASFRAPGRVSGARVESTRDTDREERIAKARAELARARDAEAYACASLDAQINTLEVGIAEYRSEREQLNASMVESTVLAEGQERLAARLTEITSSACSKVEEVVLQLEPLIARLFESMPLFDDERVRVHAIVDEAYAAASQARQYRADQEAATEAARTARTDAWTYQRQIDAIDVDNAPITEQIEKLRTERARIARRHQPKIDRAQKTLRRLTYLAGGSAQEERSQDEAPQADVGGTP